jgi:hypothetical protein
MHEEEKKTESIGSFDARVRRKFGAGMASFPDGEGLPQQDPHLVMVSEHGEIWVDEPHIDPEGTVTFHYAFVMNRGEDAPPPTGREHPRSVVLRHTPHYDERFHCMRAVVTPR